MNYRLLIFFLLIPLFSFAQNEEEKRAVNSQDHLIYATIWYQRSPEMKAIYYQCFNIAKRNLQGFVKQNGNKPKAVIVDIDETMLDNSPFEAKQILESKGFSSGSWKQWTDLAKAKALPGAVEFTKFCDSLGIEVFYVSNRKTDELESTLKNLDSLGFSFSRKENMFFKTDVSSKKQRRDIILQNYDIVMLIGDNLNDLSEIFETREDGWGTKLVDRYKDEFGNRFIVLPNPMYGDWEKNIFNSKDLSEDEKRILRLKALLL